MTRDPNDAPPPESPDENWAIVAKYLAGEAGPDEERRARAWLAGEAGRTEAVDALNRQLANLAHPAPDVDVEAALRAVRERLDTPDVQPIETARTARERQPPRPRITLLRIAAGLAVAVGAAALWWSLRSAETGGGVQLAASRFETATGEVDTLRLPDGTQVVLGPASRLDLAAGYGADARDMTLNGLATFDVIHDEARPFYVRANGALIEDLGTRFAVRTEQDGEVSVAVTEGRVALRGEMAPAQAAIVLEVGDRAAFLAGGSPRVERGVSLDGDLAWLERRLVFEDEPLARVADALRRWHGVEMQFEEASLSERRLTATFEDEPVERILDVIGLALGAQLERRGDSVFVRTVGAR